MMKQDEQDNQEKKQKKQKKDKQDKKTKKHVNVVYVILGCMIAVQLATIIYAFQFEKEGCHSDEIWSYGFANSYYQKNLHVDENNELINYEEWVDGAVLRDYVVVNEGEQFQYDSVYQNQIDDLSPPLHSMILHTICSFFPEHFSLWYSFVINIVSFVICMIFLFRTGRLLKDDWFALCCCALYGFSMEARDTYIYLRMYAMCAALTMVVVYHLVAYLQRVNQKDKLLNGNLLGLCLVSFLAFLTHFYMIALIGLLTFFTCVVLLFQKKFKAMFVYGFSMLGSFLLSVLAFPSLLYRAQAQSTDIAETAAKEMNYTFDLRMRMIANFLTKKLFDIPFPIYRRGYIKIIVVTALVIALWATPILYPFRDTRFVKKRLRMLRFIATHVKSVFRYLWRRINWIYIVFFLSILGQMIVVSETSNVYGMGVYEDRYIMNLCPLASVVGVAFLYLLGRILVKKKKFCRYVTVGVTILIMVLNLYNRYEYITYFFLEETEGQTIAESVKDKDCIYVVTKAWLLTAAVPYLMDCDEFFMVHHLRCGGFEEQYREKLEQGPVLLVLDTDFLNNIMAILAEQNLTEDDGTMTEAAQQHYQAILDYFEDLVPETKMEKLGAQNIYDRKTEVYLINP